MGHIKGKVYVRNYQSLADLNLDLNLRSFSASDGRKSIGKREELGDKTENGDRTCWCSHQEINCF